MFRPLLLRLLPSLLLLRIRLLLLPDVFFFIGVAAAASSLLAVLLALLVTLILCCFPASLVNLAMAEAASANSCTSSFLSRVEVIHAINQWPLPQLTQVFTVRTRYRSRVYRLSIICCCYCCFVVVRIVISRTKRRSRSKCFSTDISPSRNVVAFLCSIISGISIWCSNRSVSPWG